jgi:hypothetical protein
MEGRAAGYLFLSHPPVRAIQLASWRSWRGHTGAPEDAICEYLRLFRSILDYLSMVQIPAVTLPAHKQPKTVVYTLKYPDYHQ